MRFGLESWVAARDIFPIWENINNMALRVITV